MASQSRGIADQEKTRVWPGRRCELDHPDIERPTHPLLRLGLALCIFIDLLWDFLRLLPADCPAEEAQWSSLSARAIATLDAAGGLVAGVLGVHVVRDVFQATARRAGRRSWAHTSGFVIDRQDLLEALLHDYPVDDLRTCQLMFKLAAGDLPSSNTV